MAKVNGTEELENLRLSPRIYLTQWSGMVRVNGVGELEKPSLFRLGKH